MTDPTILDHRIRRTLPSDVRTIQVDQIEMFVLSRLDAPTTVRVLCGMLAVPLEHALACVNSLVRKGLVKLEPASSEAPLARISMARPSAPEAPLTRASWPGEPRISRPSLPSAEPAAGTTRSIRPPLLLLADEYSKTPGGRWAVVRLKQAYDQERAGKLWDALNSLRAVMESNPDPRFILERDRLRELAASRSGTVNRSGVFGTPGSRSSQPTKRAGNGNDGHGDVK